MRCGITMMHIASQSRMRKKVEKKNVKFQLKYTLNENFI